MSKSENNNLNHYDTSINIIGGLRDVSVIPNAIATYFDHSDSFEELISERNELNLRTERSRKRIHRAIAESFLTFKNQDHEDLIKSVFKTDRLLPDWELLVFWQFALSNRLFREISLMVYVEQYFSGRTTMSKEDIIAYLKEFISQNKHLDLGWSENTIHTLSTKYLNLMTKINFLEGARTKTFRQIRISDESLVIFLYFARLHAPGKRNILKNELLPLSFVTPEDLLDRLKRLSLKGDFEMSLNGVELNIELTHSYRGISDALYN